MLLLDEYLALPALAGLAPQELVGEGLALTYGRAYRLTRALLDSGPGRGSVRGRFTRLVDGLGPADQRALFARLAYPDPEVLIVVDPRPLIGAAAAIQNTYAMSLLQAETLAAAVSHSWPVRFGDPASATETVVRAAEELGLDLAVLEL